MNRIAQSHELCRQVALGYNFDYLFHLESDIFPHQTIIEDLILAKKSVIGALYHIGQKEESELMVQIAHETSDENFLMTRGLRTDLVHWLDGTIKKAYHIGLGCCFPSDTLILNEKRLPIKISEIKKGDTVITHSGKKEKVVDTMVRQYKDDIVIITPKYLREPIMVTKEHPIFAIKKADLKDKYNYYKKDAKISASFIEAKNLEDGDFVAYPIIKNNPLAKKHLYISDYLFNYSNTDGLHVEDGLITSKNSFAINKKNSLAKIAKKHNISSQKIYLSLKWIELGEKPTIKWTNQNYSISESSFQKVKTILEKEGIFEKPSTTKVKNKIIINEDFAKLYGWYIAEGSASNGTIEFSLGGHEMEYAIDIQKWILEIFGIESKITERKEANTIRVVACNKILATFFGNIAGLGAENKEIKIIDNLVNAGKSIVESFLNAYISGDGHKRNEYTSMTTISLNLAHNLKDLLMFLGKMPTLRKAIAKKSKIRGRIVNCKAAYTLLFYSNQKSFLKDENYFYFPIKVSYQPYKGLVYNFEVENENTYCTQSFAVHNCMIHKSVLPHFVFRYEPNKNFHPDSFFAMDLYRKGIDIYADTNMIVEHDNRPHSKMTVI